MRLILRHLIHWTSNNVFSEEIRSDIFYASTGRREIDFLAIKHDTALAIESKERRRIDYHMALANYFFPKKKQ